MQEFLKKILETTDKVLASKMLLEVKEEHLEQWNKLAQEQGLKDFQELLAVHKLYSFQLREQSTIANYKKSMNLPKSVGPVRPKSTMYSTQQVHHQ